MINEHNPVIEEIRKAKNGPTSESNTPHYWKIFYKIQELLLSEYEYDSVAEVNREAHTTTASIISNHV